MGQVADGQANPELYQTLCDIKNNVCFIANTRVGFDSVRLHAEAFGDWPINEEGFSDHFRFREISPEPRIGTVHRVVAHDEQGIRGDSEIVSGPQRLNQRMAIIMIFLIIDRVGVRARTGKGIEIFETGCCCRDRLAVHHQMAHAHREIQTGKACQIVILLQRNGFAT